MQLPAGWQFKIDVSFLFAHIGKTQENESVKVPGPDGGVQRTTGNAAEERVIRVQIVGQNPGKEFAEQAAPATIPERLLRMEQSADDIVSLAAQIDGFRNILFRQEFLIRADDDVSDRIFDSGGKEDVVCRIVKKIDGPDMFDLPQNIVQSKIGNGIPQFGRDQKNFIMGVMGSKDI